ncbi:response regulator, partial [Streptomyces prunicolor]|uniref:response regulator n=1 Tax=Streptomyces prunicolor TaxID=67348 RepID=UPI0033D90753
MTTVLIVDDQPLQRIGFRMLLNSSPETTVVGEAEHGAEAVRRTAELHPDVVLMDIRMPGMARPSRRWRRHLQTLSSFLERSPRHSLAPPPVLTCPCHGPTVAT